MKAEGGRLVSSVVPQVSVFSPWPHRIALILACATFPLLFIGGLVTSKGAGLAVPDWPTTFGYNMFLYPWSKMIGNIFYEHSHRLVASFVGLLTVALVLTFWLRERRGWLRWLGVGALGLVIVQGVMGGLRVVLLEDTLAIVHAALAQAFFALTVALAVFTSAGWQNVSATHPLTDGGRLRRLCAVATGLVYLQAIFGAVLRHTGERLDAHLAFAALVALHVVLILIRVTRHHSNVPALTRPALLLFGLLMLQLALGTLSYMAKYTTLLRLTLNPIVLITTTHLAVGALILAASAVLTLRAFRLSGWSRGRSVRELFVEQFSS
jgi:heme a synthase